MSTSVDTPAAAGGPMYEMSLTPTDYWNDSCSVQDLSYAIARGAVGATSNPTIVAEVLDQELDLWRDRIGELIAGHPGWTEDEVTWALVEEMAVRGAGLLGGVFTREHGRKGRLSIQTDPRLYRSPERLLAQGRRFDGLAPNMQVKIPATRAGISAIEDLTAEGISINATVCFTVSQALAVAAAVERGLDRHARAGGDPSALSPVCTIMMGRLDDWLAVVQQRDAILVEPGVTHWAGIACVKRAYAIYRERGYRTRLLAAAFRHHRHWTELIGGDIVLTVTAGWQRRFNESGIPVVRRFDEPVAPEIVAELRRAFPDFRRAYEPDGMDVDAFDSYGATVRTLRGFIASYHELAATIRDSMLSNPDR